MVAGPDWWFYHLERPPVAAALAPLLVKCLERSWRVLVVSPDTDALHALDTDLWKLPPEGFLPHGTSGPDAPRQPVLLSGEVASLNGAKVLVLLNGQTLEASANLQPFERIMVAFDDADGFARNQAREQFRTAKAAGATVRYFRQNDSGGWDEKGLG